MPRVASREDLPAPTAGLARPILSAQMPCPGLTQLRRSLTTLVSLGRAHCTLSWCYSLVMRDIVNALFTRQGTVLLARRSPQRNTYPGLWSFPGGHVEENETLAEALVRELREEVGVTPTRYRYLGTISDPNTEVADCITYHMYSITAWDGGEPTMLGDEHTELAWLTLETAAGLCDLALEEYRILFSKLTNG
jgi:8-oxo-dGTP diphosphatase